MLGKLPKRKVIGITRGSGKSCVVQDNRDMSNAFCVIVGLGLAPAGQLTVEVAAWLKQVDHLFYLPSPAGQWLADHEPRAIATTLDTVLDQLLPLLGQGQSTCLAVSGHPAMQPGLQTVVQQIRGRGYEAWLTAAISVEDCLFADLGLDPGRGGCQSFRASHFLAGQPRFDPRATLLLWDIAAIGRPELATLTAQLQTHYPADYPIILYEVGFRPGHRQHPLSQLPETSPTPQTLLCIRPGHSQQ